MGMDCNHCVLIPLLAVVQMMLLLIIAIVSRNLIQKDIPEKVVVYSIFLLVVCVVSALLLSFFIISALKRLCIVKKVVDLRIFNQDFEEEQGETKRCINTVRPETDNDNF